MIQHVWATISGCGEESRLRRGSHNFNIGMLLALSMSSINYTSLLLAYEALEDCSGHTISKSSRASTLSSTELLSSMANAIFSFMVILSPLPKIKSSISDVKSSLLAPATSAPGGNGRELPSLGVAGPGVDAGEISGSPESEA